MIPRLTLPLVTVLCYALTRWHAELIYPMSTGYAGTISSGWVTLSGADAVRFDHLLMWTAGLLVLVLAVDYLRLLGETHD
jgi:hypothetical protein